MHSEDVLHPKNDKETIHLLSRYSMQISIKTWQALSAFRYHRVQEKIQNCNNYSSHASNARAGALSADFCVRFDESCFFFRSVQTAVSVSAGSTAKMVDEAGDRFVGRIILRIVHEIRRLFGKENVARTHRRDAISIVVETKLTSKSVRYRVRRINPS